jgi:hypothetical protein
MHRDHQKVGVAREGGFHAIGMMGVEIDIGEAGESGAAEGHEGEDGVVEVAKPVGAVGQAVMGAAAGDVDRACAVGGQQLGGQHDAACAGGGAAEHLGEHGVRGGAEVVAGAGVGIHFARLFGPLQGGNIGGGVKGGQRGGLGAGADTEPVGGQPAKRAAEVHHGGDAGNTERVMVAVGRAAIDAGAQKKRPGQSARISQCHGSSASILFTTGGAFGRITLPHVATTSPSPSSRTLLKFQPGTNPSVSASHL